MTNKEAADFASVGNLLMAVEASWEAAEAHGAFCGRACLAGADAIKQWVGDIGSDADMADALTAERFRELQQLVVSSLLKLEAGQMEFRLLLPDDSEPLENRAVALADWCHGFMQGLAMAGGADNVLDSAGVNTDLIDEILADFTEITKAGAEPDEADLEIAERHFEELSEYVRVSAQLVYEETTGLRKARRRESTKS